MSFFQKHLLQGFHNNYAWLILGKSRSERPKGKILLLKKLWTRPATQLQMLLVILLVPTVLQIPVESYALTERYEKIDVLEGDVLAVYIYPVVEWVMVDIKPLERGNPFDASIATNYTDTYFKKATVVWMRPATRGSYNVTISFQSYKGWEYTVGVYARNYEFYGKNVRFTGNFGRFYSFARDPGNWTLSLVVNAVRLSSGSIFQIELPTPVNAALFAMATGFIMYFNVFLFFDTYFKSKRELVSGKRWFLFGMAVFISIIAIYGLYTFSTVGVSWGV